MEEPNQGATTIEDGVYRTPITYPDGLKVVIETRPIEGMDKHTAQLTHMEQVERARYAFPDPPKAET